MTAVVLASGSAARRRMLENAGIRFSVQTAPVDEAALRAGLAGATTEQAATVLAAAKAQMVSEAVPAALVIGADQILDLDGTWLEKPGDVAAARQQLWSLRGRTHHLVSAVVAWQRGRQIWQAVDRAELEMRPFSVAFLEDYMAQAGMAVTSCVGAYQLEGLGAQLFESVRGDYFTVLGMPLLPVLAMLRQQGVLIS